jgi:hypothetical protein
MNHNPGDDDATSAGKAGASPMNVKIFFPPGRPIMSDLTAADVEPAPPPSDADLYRVANLAERLRRERAHVIEATKLLKEALGRYYQLADKDLPDALANVASEFRLPNGMAVAVDDIWSANQLTNAEGLDYVERSGNGSVIKTTVTVELDRGDLEVAKALFAELRGHRLANSFKGLKLDRYVHPQTLGALVRELEEQGKNPPLETLGVTRLSRARVGDKRPKTVKLSGFAER